ncbi:MAG: hypothetical protein IPM97_07570 [Bdellovibrionaceae bacterium]|nr:hypothetical protein [Pseudobdellovibrionaceae bacterium]
MTLHNPKLAAPNSLVIDDYTGGLRLERYHLIEGGIGASGNWWYEGAENYKKHLTAFVGLIPILGSQMHSIQYVNTVKEVELVPEITSVPDQAVQLKTWAVGDSVNYLKSGGLIFFAGLAYSGYGPGVTAIAKGTWSVFVQKNSPTDVYVKITKGDLKSFSTTIAGALVSAGVSTFKGADQGFSFLINTRSKVGQRAYEDLVRGNVGAVQKLALENKDVRYIDTQKVGTTANYFNFFFGLPILANATFSAGKLHTFSQTDLIIDTSKADVHYGVFVQDQRTKFFGTHTNNTASFAGAAYKITDSKGTANGYFGQYVVNVGDESSTSGDVSRFIDEVIRKSGLSQQMSLIIPKGDYDYASANLEVIYSQVQTDRMMSLVAKMNKYQFANSYTQYVGDYFFKLGDPWKLCADASVDYTQCVDKVKARTESALLEMWESLTKMKANINNPEAFAKAYGQFGKGATENALTFQVSLVLAGEGVELYYRIEGARFSLYELYFQTTKTPGSFKVVSKPGQPLPVSAPVTRADRNRGIIVAPNYPVYPPVNP